MMWCLLGMLGLLAIALFCWLIFGRRENFQTQHLGLLTLGLIFTGIGIAKPKIIKYGLLELDLRQAKEEAEEATRVALEAAALLIWNEGKADAAIGHNEEIAVKILERWYGHEDAKKFLKEMDRGLENAQIPSGFNSPLYEKYLKPSIKKKWPRL